MAGIGSGPTARKTRQPATLNVLVQALERNTAAQNRLAEGIETQAMAIHALADAIATAASDAPEGDGESSQTDVPRYMDGTPVG